MELSNLFKSKTGYFKDHKDFLKFISRTKLEKFSPSEFIPHLVYINNYISNGRTQDEHESRYRRLFNAELDVAYKIMERLSFSEDYKKKRDEGLERTIKVIKDRNLISPRELSLSHISLDRRKEIIRQVFKVYSEEQIIAKKKLPITDIEFYEDKHNGFHAHLEFDTDIDDLAVYTSNYSIHINTTADTYFRHEEIFFSCSDVIHEAQHILQMELANQYAKGQLCEKSKLYEDAKMIYLLNLHDQDTVTCANEIYEKIFLETDARSVQDNFALALKRQKAELYYAPSVLK
ncbi:MAG: hypothetical protein KDJ35_02495 [Alphaproteobacteria bacterium]|nr:hypothetical protein [Alphaproteobacteria bacterium]